MKCFAARLAPVPQHLADAQWQCVDVGCRHQLNAQHPDARWQRIACVSKLSDPRGRKSAIQIDRRRRSVDTLDLEPICCTHWPLEQNEDARSEERRVGEECR